MQNLLSASANDPSFELVGKLELGRVWLSVRRVQVSKRPCAKEQVQEFQEHIREDEEVNCCCQYSFHKTQLRVSIQNLLVAAHLAMFCWTC